LGRLLSGVVPVVDGRTSDVVGPAPVARVVVVAPPDATVVAGAGARVVAVVADGAAVVAGLATVVAGLAEVVVGLPPGTVVAVVAAPATVVVVAIPPVVGPARVVDDVADGAALGVVSLSWRLMRVATDTPSTVSTTSNRKIVTPRLIGPPLPRLQPHNFAAPERKI